MHVVMIKKRRGSNLIIFVIVATFFSFWLLLPTHVLAQSDTIQWFRDFEKENRVTFYVGSFNRDIQIETLKNQDNEKSVRFSPNSFVFVGANLQFKNFFLYLEAAVPNTHKVNPDDTDVKGYAVFLSHFKENWGFTAFAGYNKGLLMGISNGPLYVDRNDIRRFTLGFHHYKIFNSKRFSYISPNSGGNQQIRPAGSAMVLTTPSFHRIQSNSSLLPEGSGNLHFTGLGESLRSLQLMSIQVKPGYIYNFVWGKGRYFFSPSVYAGIGGDYHRLEQKENHIQGFNLNAGYRLKSIAGINNNGFYITAEWLKESSRSFLYGSQLKNAYQEISMNFGVRFLFYAGTDSMLADLCNPV
jgi:hypothetical protein